MRRVVSSPFVSLDGVTESPDQWQFDFDAEMGAEMERALANADAVLLGRVTCTEWAGYRPNVSEGEDAGFAAGSTTRPSTSPRRPWTASTNGRTAP